MPYWQQRFQWTNTQAASIDIRATQAASRKTRPDMARRIQKLRCGWLLVNNREARSDPDRVSGCSACSLRILHRKQWITSFKVHQLFDDEQFLNNLQVSLHICVARKLPNLSSRPCRLGQWHGLSYAKRLLGATWKFRKTTWAILSG